VNHPDPSDEDMSWFKRDRRDRKEKRKAFTRIFFATDVHGSEPCFIKFVNAASFYKADVIVLGGDITGKQIVTIERRDDEYRAHLFGQDWVARTPQELAQLEKHIRTNGFYPYVATADELAELSVDGDKVADLFSRLMCKTVERWLRMAEERLRDQPVKCFISPGNDDSFDLDPILESSDVVICPEGRVVDLDGEHTMVSCGYANMTPWRCPRDIEDDELRHKLESTLSRVEDPSHCVFNFHAPPYDSTLDTAPQVDADLKPVLVGGQPHMIPVGSVAVREAIEKYQPIVGLHGHIHECRGAVRLGRTLCVNPGSEYSEGILRGVLVNIADGRLVSHQFVTG
jgi:Icc-related predicted phosphoesterase